MVDSKAQENTPFERECRAEEIDLVARRTKGPLAIPTQVKL